MFPHEYFAAPEGFQNLYYISTCYLDIFIHRKIVYVFHFSGNHFHLLHSSLYFLYLQSLVILLEINSYLF